MDTHHDEGGVEGAHFLFPSLGRGSTRATEAVYGPCRRDLVGLEPASGEDYQAVALGVTSGALCRKRK